ncbi:MAG: tripartite tricarboxylate transporter substrate binding protein [Burkholderiales bacterium]|nr:tripartite tricarboxylate transporter substrate binding protein [Burkholderiales bacterium]
MAIVLSLSSALAQSTWKPGKNVEVVAGVAAGGNMDRTARAIQAILQERKFIPSTSVVVNKPGGGQALGLQYVKSQAGDPHYLSVNSEPLLTNRIAGRSPIEFTDFTPIAHLFNEYIAFIVRADSPLKSGQELVERLKTDPAAITIAVGAALGNVNHIALALLMGDIKADVRRVKIPVFNSTGESMTALLGGHIDLVIATLASVVGPASAGKVRVLALTSPKRLPGILASAPTWRELGHDVTFASFRVVVAPKGLGKEQVAYWDSVFAQLVETEEWKKDMDRFYWVSNYLNSAQTGDFLRQRNGQLRKIYAEIGLAK